MTQRIRAQGFTLIELLVVLAVMGILAMAVWPLSELTLQRERERELRRALWEIRDALDAYKRAVDQGQIQVGASGSGYPPDLKALVQGVPNLTGGGTTFFLRRIPRDPFADKSVAPMASWGLRSYQSPPDDPKPGEDVFDVFSRSERLGLNGVPLKDW